MNWNVCIRYPDGQERPLRTYKSREVALRKIDAIYSQGYPMHIAYVVRPEGEVDHQFVTNSSLQEFQPV